MKIRQGFVSNSSSSSFIIAKEHLSELQIKKIKNHIEESINMGMYKYEDNEWYYNQEWAKKQYPTEEDKHKASLKSYKNNAWFITEDDYNITGHTSMDNFDMYDFFEKIGIDKNKISYDG